MMSAVKHFFTRFISDKHGAIGIIAAVAMPVLFALGGGAYDFGIQQMAWKNAQYSADIAATSAAASRRFEAWGKPLPTGPTETQRLQQEARVRALYNINTRGYNLDPNFTPQTITVVQEGDGDTPSMYTHVAGNSKVPTGFIKLVGVNSLDYTIDTKIRHRVPGAKVTRDVVMFLDYTTSMLDGFKDEPGISKFDALKAASTGLVDYVMCGNNQGQPCNEDARGNRMGFIPYTTSSLGLDICDLEPGQTNANGETRPASCDCEVPRGFPGGYDAWVSEANRCGITGGEYPTCMPELCRPSCDRIDRNGRPASDPESDFFNCSCYDIQDGPGQPNASHPITALGGDYRPVDWETRVVGQCRKPSLALGDGYHDNVSQKCIGLCPQNRVPGPQSASGYGCCNPCDKLPNVEKYSREWAQCTLGRARTGSGTAEQDGKFGCGCAQPLEIVPGPVTLLQMNENNGQWRTEECPGPWCVRFGSVPAQTYQCHHQSCNCSCTAAASPSPGCVAEPDGSEAPVCLPPHEPPKPPPANPPLGFLDMIPQAQLASADGMDEGAFVSAVYNPDENVFGNNPNLIFVQSVPPANMSVSLEDCERAGPGIGPSSCGGLIKDAISENEYLENFGTNSSSAFKDFGNYLDYLNFMRPNTNEAAPGRMENVVIWISDGKNTRFNPRPGQDPRLAKPEQKFINGQPQFEANGQPIYQDVGGTNGRPLGPDYDEFRYNCYQSNGTYARVSACPTGTGNDAQGTCPSQACPAGSMTAQQLADKATLDKCRELRTRSSNDGQQRMTIYTIFISGENTTDAEERHSVRLMTECSYGTAYDEGSLPTNIPKRFFLARDYEGLRAAFENMINEFGVIRITR